eukprot:5179941-Pyramimonas_sp.AAC.1
MPRCLRDPEACEKGCGGSQQALVDPGRKNSRAVCKGKHHNRPLKLGSWRTPGAWARELVGGHRSPRRPRWELE